MKLLALASVLAGFILLGVAVLPLGTSAKNAPPLPPPALPVGHDEARPGATLENGWVIADIGPCAFLSFYQKAWNVLGEPVSSFDGVRQWFEFGQLVCLPDSPAGQQVVLANLGYDELRSTGQLPQPQSPPAPAVQDFLALSLERGGIDPATYFGEPISAPSCDKAGHCLQYLEKTEVTFDQGATTGEAVARAPLGLWQSHPETRPAYVQAKLQAAQGRQVRLPLLVAGVVALVGGLALLAQRLAGQRFGAGATI